jgi:hypothetical protein
MSMTQLDFDHIANTIACSPLSPDQNLVLAIHFADAFDRATEPCLYVGPNGNKCAGKGMSGFCPACRGKGTQPTYWRFDRHRFIRRATENTTFNTTQTPTSVIEPKLSPALIQDREGFGFDDFVRKTALPINSEDGP